MKQAIAAIEAKLKEAEVLAAQSRRVANAHEFTKWAAKKEELNFALTEIYAGVERVKREFIKRMKRESVLRYDCLSSARAYRAIDYSQVKKIINDLLPEPRAKEGEPK